MSGLRNSTARRRAEREMLLTAFERANQKQRRSTPPLLYLVAMFVVGFGLGQVFFGDAEAHHAHRNKVPLCAEDEFITGHGDFAHGEWESYRCSHPDDYVPAYIESEYRNPAVHSAVGGSVCEHKRFWKRSEGISIIPEGCDGH